MANSFEDPDPYAAELPAPAAAGPAAVGTARRGGPTRPSALPSPEGSWPRWWPAASASRRAASARRAPTRSGPGSSRPPRRR